MGRKIEGERERVQGGKEMHNVGCGCGMAARDRGLRSMHCVVQVL